MGNRNPQYDSLEKTSIDMGPGNAFNYDVWSAGSRVTLSRVRWDAAYRDVVNFKTDWDLQQYLKNHGAGTHSVNVTRMTYLPMGQPVTVDVPIGRAQRYNYLWVHNDAQPVQSKNANVRDQKADFYYFITGVEYVSPNTTRLALQLDVWQTYIRTTRFAKAFVERGHLAVAATYRMRNKWESPKGRGLLTEPEGFELGSEYRVANGWRFNVFSKSGTGKAYDYGMVIVSTTNLAASPGTKDDPKVSSARGSYVDGLVSGADIYYADTALEGQRWLQSLKDYPWLTQGIVQVYMVPRVQMGTSGSPKAGDEYVGERASKKFKVWRVLETKMDQQNNPVQWKIPNFRRLMSSGDVHVAQGRYKYLAKLFTYPYMAVEITGYNGTSVMLKPENIHGLDLYINFLYHQFPPSPRIAAYPANYNRFEQYLGGIGDGSGTGTVDISPYTSGYGKNWMRQMVTSDYLANAVTFDNFPQSPIINDNAALALANTAHTRAFEYRSADWSQQRAMMQAQNARDIAGMQMQTNSQMASNSMTAAGQSAALSNSIAGQRRDLANTQNIVGTGAGVIGSALTGNLGGVVSGLVNGGMNYYATQQQYAMGLEQTNGQLAIQNQQTAANLQAQNRMTGYAADHNYALARKAAAGDYANTIAGLNAKVQDLQMTPPGMQGTYGGESLALSTTQGLWLVVHLKTINEGALARQGEYWLRYGYATNRWARFPKNFMAMSDFTYWKCQAVTIFDSRAPEPYKEAIRGIFERGVTVWNDPAKINNMNFAQNKPLEKMMSYLDTSVI